MRKSVTQKPGEHIIEVSFKNGVFIDGKPTKQIFDYTLRDLGIEKDEEINIQIGEDIVDRAFALEIEELLINIGFTKVRLIDHS